MAFSRNLKSLGFDFLTLILEWINYAFFLMIVEGMAFTVRTTTRYKFCISPNGSRVWSGECKAVYATLAFAGVDLLLSFIAAIAITFAIQWKIYLKFKGRRKLFCTKRPKNASRATV